MVTSLLVEQPSKLARLQVEPTDGTTIQEAKPTIPPKGDESTRLCDLVSQEDNSSRY